MKRFVLVFALLLLAVAPLALQAQEMNEVNFGHQPKCGYAWT